MQVKIFEADNMAAGLKQVKEELGPDALIISTRTVKNSKLGLLGKSTLEITAAIDNLPVSAPLRAAQTTSYQQPAVTSSVPQSPQVNFVVDDTFNATPATKQNAPCRASYTNEINSNKFQADSSVSDQPVASAVHLNQATSRAASAFSSNIPQDNNIMGEVEDLKNLVRSLAGEVARLQPENSTTTQIATPPVEQEQNENLGDINSILAQNGINTDISETISQFLQNNLDSQALANPTEVQRYALQAIQSMIEVTPPFHSDTGQQRIAFVGPTGVGKTTTLAKLAAAQLSAGGKSIALITIDTYRIAAVEQLKVYGEIMNLPVDVVLSPDQLENALLKHRDRDIILIDTAGRSPKDELSINELATFLRPELNIEKHLVLSATSRENELIDIIERFKKLDIHGTIFTKVDECSQLGALLNVQIQNNKPISCLTNGQRVPEDLLEISPQRIAELIMSTN